MLLEILFGGIVTILMPVRAWRRYRQNAPPAPAGRYITETLLLITTLSLLLWRRHVSFGTLGLAESLSFRWFCGIVFCLLVVVGTNLWMVGRITAQIQSGATVPAPKGLAADALAGQKAGFSFIVVTLVGATWEELCFRAAVFAIVPHTIGGIFLGVVAGSLAFGAQHLRNGTSGMIYSSVFGLIFALLFVATGNLWGVMLSHAAGNLLTARRWGPQIERARQNALARQSALPSAPSFLG